MLLTVVAALMQKWALVGIESLVLIPFLMVIFNQSSVLCRRILLLTWAVVTLSLAILWVVYVVFIIDFMDVSDYCVLNAWNEYSL